MTRHEKKHQRHERQVARARHERPETAVIQVGSEFVSYHPTRFEIHEHVRS